MEIKFISSGIVSLFLLTAIHANAVLLYGTGSATEDVSNRNTTAPTGAYAGSGWDWQGKFGIYSGTAIGPHHFISARHIEGDPGNGLYLDASFQPTANTKFNLNGTVYSVTATYKHPAADLTIWEISGTFPTYAKLYAEGDVGEIAIPLDPSREFVFYGRGGGRGPAVYNTVAAGGVAAGTLRGWQLPSGLDGKIRWGVGKHATVTAVGSPHIALPFNATDGPDSFALSYADSGGGLYTKDHAGAWCLVGIAHVTANVRYTQIGSSSSFYAAIFDPAGLAPVNGSYGADPFPVTWSGFTSIGSGNVAASDSSGPPPDGGEYLGWILNILGRGRFTYEFKQPTTGCALKLGGKFTGTITIQKSSDLVTWTTLSTVSASTAINHTTACTDPTASSASVRFYRAVDSTGLKSENAVGYYVVPVGSSSSTTQWSKLMGKQLVPMWAANIDWETGPLGVIPPGWSLPDNAGVAKSSPATGMIVNTYNYDPDVDYSVWMDPWMRLDYGDGFYVLMPPGTTGSVVVQGEVSQTYSTTIVPGWNRLLCLPKYAGGYMNSTFGFTPVAGDIVRRLVTPNGTTQDSTYSSSTGWPSTGYINAGYGFWYWSNRAAPVAWNYSWALWP